MNRRLASTVLVVTIITSLAALAQERRQAGPTPYNLANEKTMTAKVVGLDSTEPIPGREVTFLAVTVNGEPLSVFLPPPEWLKKQNFSFPAGATAEILGVTGYRLNGDAVMPRKIKIGTRTLTLRDERGNPLWESQNAP